MLFYYLITIKIKISLIDIFHKIIYLIYSKPNQKLFEKKTEQVKFVFQCIFNKTILNNLQFMHKNQNKMNRNIRLYYTI